MVPNKYPAILPSPSGHKKGSWLGYAYVYGLYGGLGGSCWGLDNCFWGEDIDTARKNISNEP